MSRTRGSALIASVAAAALAVVPAAAAATGVAPARGAVRSALIHAFVVHDGSSAGVRGAFVSVSNRRLGVICQKTPDAGSVSFLFTEVGHAWRYQFETNGTSRGSSAQHQLEHACR
jgi:hypothetical protein